MSEKRVCEGCGNEYWWPTATWQHEKCLPVLPATDGSKLPTEASHQPSGEAPGGQSAAFDRKSYQRKYMRKYRARKREKT